MYIFVDCIYIYIFYIIYNTWFDLSEWHDLAGCFRQRRLMSSHRSQSSTDSRVHFSWYGVCLSHGMVFTGIFELQILVNLAWKVATCSHLATPQLGQSPRKLCLVCLNLGIQSPKDVVQRRRGRFFDAEHRTDAQDHQAFSRAKGMTPSIQHHWTLRLRCPHWSKMLQ